MVIVVVAVVVVIVGGSGGNGSSGRDNNFKILSHYAGLLRYRNPLIEYGWIYNNSPIIWLKKIK